MSDGVISGMGRSGMGDQQLLHSARPEAFRQPKNVNTRHARKDLIGGAGHGLSLPRALAL